MTMTFYGAYTGAPAPVNVDLELGQFHGPGVAQND